MQVKDLKRLLEHVDDEAEISPNWLIIAMNIEERRLWDEWLQSIYEASLKRKKEDKE